MNKYKSLLSNTILFAVSTFSSKVLVFFLMPLYTTVLTTYDYGVVDLIVQSANLLIPVVSVGIMNSVIRFGLDSHYDKRQVFTTGLTVIFAGLSVFLCFIPLIRMLDFIDKYFWLLYLYVLMACMRSLFSQFVRARSLMRLYALDGLLSTILTILFNLLFLLQFEMGVMGYLAAIICADLCSALFLFAVAGLSRYIRFKRLSKAMTIMMLAYAVPLIPAQMFWWVTNVSDRFLISYMLSKSENGLYAAATKIPTIVVVFSTIFTEAWQLSAIKEGKSDQRARFFSNIFLAYQGIVFIAAAALIFTCKFIMSILVNKAFYEAWRFIPILIMSMVFSCFVSFLGSVYMVEKRSMLTLITMLIGASLNIILNILLIPIYGVNGAAISTFASYLLVFIIRAVNTKKYIHIDFSVVKMIFNTAILAAMSYIMLKEIKYYEFICGGLVFVVFSANILPLYHSAIKLLQKRSIAK